MRSTKSSLAALASLVVLSPSIGLAETPADDPEENSTVADPSELVSGYQWAGFRVRPELAVSLMYDSNIFATRTDEVSDTIALISPAISLDSTWDKHELGMETGATLARYRDNSDENYQDYWANMDGRYDITDNTNVFGGFGYTFDHEDRSSPDDNLVGNEPTTFDSRHAHAGFAHRMDKFRLRVGGTFEALDYDNVGVLRNDDRDRDVTGLGARAGYRLHTDYELYVQAVRDKRDYDLPSDDNGFNRDSDGYRVAVGFKGKFTNRLQGGAYVGRIKQYYDDNQFADVSKPDFSGALTFRATPRTTVTAAVDRTLEETTLPGASSYLYTEGDVSASHRLDSRVRVSAGISAGEADYLGISRRDRLYTANASLRYYLTRHVYVAGTYRSLIRDSNLQVAVNNPANVQDTDDYARQQIFVTVGSLLYPIRGVPDAFPPSVDRLRYTGSDSDGLYAGARFSHGTFHMRTKGLRGGSGIDDGEFGDEGAGGGLFVGYGLNIDRWYLGLELDGGASNADIYHRKGKAESRTLDVSSGHSMGLALRGGYRVASDALLYARAGRVRTEFETLHTINNEPQNAVDETFEETGNRFGVGADIPAGDHAFVRMEYAYTKYDDYNVNLVTHEDDFTPKSSQFNLGLGWNIGGNSEETSTDAGPVNTGGFYAGAHVGHGAVNSHLVGSHIDSGTGPFPFIGDFGDTSGFTGGVFAGVGHNWQRWYLGLEAEVDASSASWRHVRFPNGRNFDVEKKNTYGLSVRAGYQLPAGALLYAKAGRVRARFNTGWVKGGNRSNDVDRDDTVSGNRYALGADIPVTRSLFVRTDYAFSEYDSYDFTTSHASADTMTFDNTETMFRLGLGARF